MQSAALSSILPPQRVRQLAFRGCLWPVHSRGRATMASATVDSPFVSVDWLKENLHKPDVRILDASWFLATMGRDAKEEFKQKRICGAQFFDIDGVANTSIPLPHMVPSEAAFSAAASALKVGPDDTVVLYDSVGNWSSPRAWWTWKVFGHKRAAMLKGGLPAWLASDGDISEDAVDDAVVEVATVAAATGSGGSYPAQLDQSLVKSMQEVTEALKDGVQVVDARSSGRFTGSAPEPRPEIPSGAMPGAFNIPFTELLVGEVMDGEFKDVEGVQNAFAKAGVDLDKPTICTCGSGATAALLSVGIYMLTGRVGAVYDGSWMEWATNSSNPIVKGEY